MRKRREGVLERLYGEVAALPPWVGIVLAIPAYLVLHWLAGWHPHHAAGPSQAAANFGSAIGRALAWVAQVALPALLLLASAVSRINRLARGKRVIADSNSRPIPPQIGAWTFDLLQALEWKRFEHVCAAYF